ncbi:exported hypothetical protein [Verrucomicrobia bacterium]|nr:exported hypothetical protein [Verrucomicrobiota bacterium]
MKTSRSARRVVRIRALAVVLAIAAIAGVEFWLGTSMVERIGQTTGVQTDGPPVPEVNFSDLMAAGH